MKFGPDPYARIYAKKAPIHRYRSDYTYTVETTTTTTTTKRDTKPKSDQHIKKTEEPKQNPLKRFTDID